LSAHQDVQGGHRNDLVKTMRGVFRENPKSRMSVRDIGALEAFSAKAWMTKGPFLAW
jgi:NADH:ubiquinone oxidoreductase subunit D